MVDTKWLLFMVESPHFGTDSCHGLPVMVHCYEYGVWSQSVSMTLHQNTSKFSYTEEEGATARDKNERGRRCSDENMANTGYVAMLGC